MSVLLYYTRENSHNFIQPAAKNGGLVLPMIFGISIFLCFLYRLNMLIFRGVPLVDYSIVLPSVQQVW